MINHSPAQLIAELERLMDMDYELLPGARHVLEEAIAVIRPLAEKTDLPKTEDQDSDHDCLDWNSGGACFICRRPISIEEQQQ